MKKKIYERTIYTATQSIMYIYLVLLKWLTLKKKKPQRNRYAEQR